MRDVLLELRRSAVIVGRALGLVRRFWLVLTEKFV